MATLGVMSCFRHLPKCFDNVHNLEFKKDDKGDPTKTAVGMYSGEHSLNQPQHSTSAQAALPSPAQLCEVSWWRQGDKLTSEPCQSVQPSLAALQAKASTWHLQQTAAAMGPWSPGCKT